MHVDTYTCHEAMSLSCHNCYNLLQPTHILCHCHHNLHIIVYDIFILHIITSFSKPFVSFILHLYMYIAVCMNEGVLSEEQKALGQQLFCVN